MFAHELSFGDQQNKGENAEEWTRFIVAALGTKHLTCEIVHFQRGLCEAGDAPLSHPKGKNPDVVCSSWEWFWTDQE